MRLDVIRRGPPRVSSPVAALQQRARRNRTGGNEPVQIQREDIQYVRYYVVIELVRYGVGRPVLTLASSTAAESAAEPDRWKQTCSDSERTQRDV